MAKTQKPESATAQFSKFFETIQATLPTNKLMEPQIQQYWDAQEKLLAETQRFTQHWFERRHEAVRSGLEAARAATTGKQANPAAAMSVMMEWQKHSAERMAEDAREWFETMTRCAEHMIKTETATIDETLTEAADLARKATKSAKSEPV